MRKYSTLIALAIAGLSLFASFGASATPQESSRRPAAATLPEGSFRTADNWNDRVCCKKGGRDWWTIRRDCNAAGGYQVANRECRDDENDGFHIDLNLGQNARVCCKRGNRDWWSTARECRNSYGYQTTNRECRHDAGDYDERVCCKRGWQDWWTTGRACDRAGGYRTANRECRNDWNEQWDQRWWGWNGGDWNARVCCKKGNRDWWSTALECRNAFGYQTTNQECRNDNHDGDWNDGGNTNYNDGWVDPYGRPERRVCCKKGYRDWWSSARDCHYANGYETANKECRNN